MQSKHYISIFILSIALLASCSRTETETEDLKTPVEIAFSGAETTRGFGAVSHDYKLRVSSIYHDAASSTHCYYLNDNVFAWNSAANAWTGSNNTHYYYPLSGTMDFIAFAHKDGHHLPAVTYTPSTTESLSESSTFTQAVLDYTAEGQQLDGSEDQLIAVGVTDVACNTSVTTPVQLQFNHLLSNIRFTFKAQTVEASDFFMVTGVELLNTRMSGVVTVAHAVNNTWGVSWNSLTDPVDTKRSVSFYPVYGNSSPLPYVDFYLPTQAAAGVTGFTVHFKYRVEGNIVTNEMVYLSTDVPTPAVWVHGNRYTYQVICRMLPHIEFQVNFVDDGGFVIDSWVVEPEIHL